MPSIGAISVTSALVGLAVPPRVTSAPSKPVTVTAGEPLKVDWEVVQDKVPDKHKDKYGKDYKGGAKY